MTVASIRKVFEQELTPIYGGDEASGISWLVMGTVCGINRSDFHGRAGHEPDEQTLNHLQLILKKLKTGTPVQYVLGKADFYGSVFKVSEAVLIPRPETEELVDWIISDQRKGTGQPAPVIIDIGTGSGCIPVSLKKYIPNASVTAMDISKAALAIAEENAGLNQTEVCFVEDDILAPSSGGRYDIIVSNPPYITENEKAAIHNNVLGYEPHTALFVPDDQPLLFYKAIADFAVRNLKADGSVYLEINERFGERMISLMKVKGFNTVELRKDLNGRDRMIKARFN